MNLETLVPMLVGVVLGGTISAVIAWRSSRELRREAAQLRNLNEILIRAGENAGLMKANRNSKGETVGLVLELKSEFKAEASMTADPTVEKPSR